MRARPRSAAVASRSTRAWCNKQRIGNVVLDVLGFQRETQTDGWRFNGLILLKDGVVVYKLTGGQPVDLSRRKRTRTRSGRCRRSAAR